MKSTVLLLLVLSLSGSAVVSSAAGARPARIQPDSIRYAVRITNLNPVGLTLTNYGVVGNNFITRAPSLEYPVGTGYEHLVLGGLWFGAHAVDSAGAFVGVSTGAQDGSPGVPAEQRTEFTPAGLSIGLRSRSVSSPYYDPATISDLDYLWTFSDRPAKTVSGQLQAHRPLNILVRGMALSWQSVARQDFIVLRFTIVNLGAELTGAWVGLWTELASGLESAYSCWPPSAVCGPGSWFRKKWLQYDASRRLLHEHYCAALPIPDGCVLGMVPAWMGVQLLTHPRTGQHVTLAAWDYAPGSPLRDEDTERHAIMSTATIQDLTQPELMPQSGDPVELLAIGPFSPIAPGDSIIVHFALVGGAEVADLQAHADTAQALYDNEFGAGGPVGVDAPGTAGFSLSGAWPNPSPGGLRVSVTLPDASPARIEVMDLAGRRVMAREVGTFGAGSHVVELGLGERPRAGVYLIRLTRGGRSLSTRAVVIR